METLFSNHTYTNNDSYNGKLFLKHYIPTEKYDKEKLDKYMKRK